MSEDNEPGMRVREKVDFEQYLFEFMLNQADVLADGNMDVYETMQNALLAKLSPYMSKAQTKELNDIRKMITTIGDQSPEAQRINKERMEKKDELTSKILHELGTQLTPRKQARISKGMPLIWKAYPPLKVLELTKQ